MLKLLPKLYPVLVPIKGEPEPIVFGPHTLD
jgi:hypothetical protein